jgi:hypothetical protein
MALHRTCARCYASRARHEITASETSRIVSFLFVRVERGAYAANALPPRSSDVSLHCARTG